MISLEVSGTRVRQQSNDMVGFKACSTRQQPHDTAENEVRITRRVPNYTR